MSRNLTNKIVVIIRGAEGIGYEIADKFLQKGAKTVILVDNRAESGVEAEKRLNTKHGSNKAVFIECNIITEVEVVSQKIFSSCKVDIVLNDGGILDETNPKKTINTNVTAVVEWSLKFWEYMRVDKGGHGGTIINTPTIFGYRINEFLPIYQASKFAVMGFTKCLGNVTNFNQSGVRVVALCHGFTITKVNKLTNPPTIWDSTQNEEFNKFLKTQCTQNVEAVGNAAVEIYEKANSGTAWLIEGAKPVVEVVT